MSNRKMCLLLTVASGITKMSNPRPKSSEGSVEESRKAIEESGEIDYEEYWESCRKENKGYYMIDEISKSARAAKDILKESRKQIELIKNARIEHEKEKKERALAKASRYSDEDEANSESSQRTSSEPEPYHRINALGDDVIVEENESESENEEVTIIYRGRKAMDAEKSESISMDSETHGENESIYDEVAADESEYDEVADDESEGAVTIIENRKPHNAIAEETPISEEESYFSEESFVSEEESFASEESSVNEERFQDRRMQRILRYNKNRCARRDKNRGMASSNKFMKDPSVNEAKMKDTLVNEAKMKDTLVNEEVQSEKTKKKSVVKSFLKKLKAMVATPIKNRIEAVKEAKAKKEGQARGASLDGVSSRYSWRDSYQASLKTPANAPLKNSFRNEPSKKSAPAHESSKKSAPAHESSKKSAPVHESTDNAKDYLLFSTEEYSPLFTSTGDESEEDLVSTVNEENTRNNEEDAREVTHI